MNCRDVLAVVPARGGSKGIPSKNIARLAGRPLLAYTVDAARDAGVARIVVSTDSEEIAATARACGAEVPFLRPASLARDTTPGVPPLLHAIRWLEAHEGYRPTYVVNLQPTSPFRTAGDIQEAVRLARWERADSVLSVMPVERHPYWMKRIGRNGRLHDFIQLRGPIPRRQDLPPLYALNGGIYLARREVFLRWGSWYMDRTYAYIMPPERSLDIDTPWDWHLAELILTDQKRRGEHSALWMDGREGSTRPARRARVLRARGVN